MDNIILKNVFQYDFRIKRSNLFENNFYSVKPARRQGTKNGMIQTIERLAGWIDRKTDADPYPPGTLPYDNPPLSPRRQNRLGRRGASSSIVTKLGRRINNL